MTTSHVCYAVATVCRVYVGHGGPRDQVKRASEEVRSYFPLFSGGGTSCGTPGRRRAAGPRHSQHPVGTANAPHGATRRHVRLSNSEVNYRYEPFRCSIRRTEQSPPDQGISCPNSFTRTACIIAQNAVENLLLIKNISRRKLLCCLNKTVCQYCLS